MVKCHDCDVEEGELHKLGCDMELCPICLRQLITCYDHACNPGDGTILIKEKDPNRIIWVRIPVLCCLCGVVDPDLFILSNEEWKRTVPRNLQGEVLCHPCYDRVKRLMILRGG